MDMNITPQLWLLKSCNANLQQLPKIGVNNLNLELERRGDSKTVIIDHILLTDEVLGRMGMPTGARCKS
jgi:hypothetical protein